MSTVGLGDSLSNRVDPAMLDAVHEDHAARYAFACQFAAGARVLDVGCATGYGSARLAEVAASVVGIEPYASAVEYARAHFADHENCTFILGELQDVALAEGQFDLGVAFEVIEHVKDPVAFVERLRRLLKPDGVLVISTPHRPVSAPDGGVSDPTHLREYDPDELEEVLRSGGFGRIDLFGQHIGAGMWRRHSTRALLGRLDFLGLRRFIPARTKARMVVAASSIGANATERSSTHSTIMPRLDGAFVQIAVCRP